MLTVVVAACAFVAGLTGSWSPCGFSMVQFGGFTKDDQTPSFSITVPRVLSYMATGSFDGQMQGLNELQAQEVVLSIARVSAHAPVLPLEALMREAMYQDRN